MKKGLILLIFVLMLWGCTPKPTETPPSIETLPPTVPTVETTVPTEPEPEPLHTYAIQEPSVEAIAPMGEDVILLSGNALGQTILTRLSAPEKPVTYSFRMDLDAPSTVVCGEAMGLYSRELNQYVLLDGSLQITDQIPLPDTLSGSPWISQDLRTIFYCTADALWRLDVNTQKAQQLTALQDSSGYPYIDSMLFDDQVVSCSLNWENQYFDSRTGEQLDFGTSHANMNGWENVCCWSEYSIFTKILFQLRGSGEVQQLYPNGFGDPLILPDLGGILVAETDEDTTLLDFYTLPEGHRTASIALPKGARPVQYVAGGDGVIWVLDNENHSLYRWNLQASNPKDSAVYVNRQFTADDPDLDGLSQVEAEAAKLGEKYGVEILVWDQVDGLELPDYALVRDYRVPLFRWALQEVDHVLSTFPEGMLDTAAGTEHPLTIALIQGLYGKADNTLDSAGGLHTWYENHSLIIFTMESYMRYNLYHELNHLLDSYMFGQTTYLDDWNDLNPDGFTYSFQYTDYWDNDVQDYLIGDRYFIDNYSTTYPTEDRARIFEYAVNPDFGEFFASQHMQKKLSVLCRAIRDSFQLDPDAELLWEQFLAPSGEN